MSAYAPTRVTSRGMAVVASRSATTQMATRVATTDARAPVARRARGARRDVARRATGDDARREALRKARAKLPIDAVVDACLDALEVRRRRAKARRGTDEANDWVRCEQRATRAVMQAPPGAGKTTVMPLAAALAAASAGGGGRAGKVIVLEPRRLAAKAAAMRMAEMLGERAGETVGYQVRFERRASAATRVEVVTEGVLTRRLRNDPELRDVGLVVFDEFHERNLDADVALALCREVQQTIRPDLRLLVMSATLGEMGARVAALLRDENGPEVPVIVSEGRSYPVETIYLGAPGAGWGELERATTNAVKDAVRACPDGDVLCFLPGAAEINRVVRDLQRELPNGVVALPLYGALSQEEQAAALAPSKPGTRRVVVSTPIAESSLTINGVKVVVDSGLCKTPKFDARKGMTRLETTRVSRASADQRRGRAGRIAPGTCYRLWSEASNAKLQPDTTPEILQADLTPVALDLAAWGVGDGADMAWLDPPPEGPLIAARRLLRELGALEEGKLVPSDVGSIMSELPVHPRLARMLLFGASRGAESARLACQLAAVIGDRDLISGRDAPLDVRCRLRALWGQDPLASAGDLDEEKPEVDPTKPTRVPIGTKLPKSGKKIKGAPRGKRASVNAAVSVATGGASGASWNVDERAVREAKQVAEQLLGNLRRLASSHPDFCAPGVGEGDASAVVWSFLCGAGESEAGLLLAVAYPDRVAARKNRGGAFQLSGGGAASVGSEHKDDALLRSGDKANETLVVVELAGDGAGNAGSRNDRVRLAAPIDRACLESGGALYEALSKESDDVFWASASKSVFARRRLTVGSLVLREIPFSVKDNPEATVSAMLDGIREMGLASAFGLNKATTSWLKRAEYVHRSGVDATFPNLSEENLLSSAGEWLAPWIAGAQSKSDLAKVDVASLVKAHFCTYDHLKLVDDACPVAVRLPSGSNAQVDYDGDVPVVAARIQEFFGTTETPRVGGVNCELHLLSPAGRTQAVTRDLASFWRNAYRTDVRKELAGRYPKHFWPDDPESAAATSKTKKYM